MPFKQQSSLLSRYIVVISLVVFSTTLWGVYTHFSPVPFWDMWSGYIGFYLRVLDNDHSVWLSQHNEHRILISRILFWLDLEYFKGQGVFLVCVNLVIQLGTAFVFLAVVSKKLKADPYKTAVYAFVFCLLFSWVQRENFIWAFQSPFLFVFLFSLLSFLTMGRYTAENKKHYFLLSLFFGYCATFSMANGLLVFPLLVVQALILRASKLSIATIIAVAITASFIYFVDYQKPVRHDSTIESILQHPILVTAFTLTYLGSPFAFVLKQTFLVTATGFLFLTGTGVLLYCIIKKHALDDVNVTLFIFLLFIVGTAFATASGRIFIGLNGAMANRYATPALMGWITLILIGFINRTTLPKACFYFAKGSLICIPLLLLPQQLRAFENFAGTAFNRKIAVLGVAHHQYDSLYFEQICYRQEGLLDIIEQSIDKGISVFSSDWIKYENNKIAASSIHPEPCMGSIDSTEPFQSGSSISYRVKGWVWNPETHTVPERIILADKELNIVGYGISGEPRIDITKAIEGHPFNTGWLAYLDKPEVKGPIFAYAATDSGLFKIPGKPIELDETVRIMKISRWKGEPSSELLHISGEWKKGAIHPRVRRKESQTIYGSWVGGDAHVGRVEFEISPSNDPVNLIYMTGSDSQFQDMEIYNMGGKLLYRFNLPKSIGVWTKFSLQLNTNENIKIVVADNGNSRGQWSALLVP
tara:strand:- start:7325 stop:9424 length:2100 start_codon:yes stop_codon:yes gene_type:complete